MLFIKYDQLKKFAKTILNPGKKVFVIYMIYLEAKILIHIA